MKRVISIKKIAVFSIYIIFLVLLIFGIFKVTNSFKKTVSVEIINQIEEYNYSLDNKATDYMKSLFTELSTLLENDNYDESEYAKILSKIFLADFYTLDNKLNKNDIGGIQYIYSDFADDFTSLAQNSIYKIVKNNMYNDRNQELPIVKKVEINSIDISTFVYNEKTFENSYYINVTINYEVDLGYASNVDLVIVKNNNKLEIVKMETK